MKPNTKRIVAVKGTQISEMKTNNLSTVNIEITEFFLKRIWSKYRSFYPKNRFYVRNLRTFREIFC